jgi:hypothetical protein
MIFSNKSIKNVSIKLFESKLFIPAILLLFSVLSFGLFINRQGFYWDDLPYLYLNHSQGILGYPAYMSTDRPFSAWFFMLEGSLFGENALGYHLLALMLRWACAWAFYWVLGLVLRENKAANFISVTLFLVYPGFLQQPISLIYSLHFTVLLLFLCSLGLMLFSIQEPKYYLPLTILSLVFSLGIFSSEYFAMLELLRPVLLWKYMSKRRGSTDQMKNQTFRVWSPYLIVFIVFLTWRIFIFKFPTYGPDMLNALIVDSGNTILNLFIKIIRDLYTVIVSAWVQIFFPSFLSSLNVVKTIIWLIISLSSSFLFWLILFKIVPPRKNNNSQWNRSALLIGIFALILGGIPVWVTGLPVELNFAWDRLTLPFTLGIGLLITGMVFTFIKKNIVRYIFLSILIGFSIGYQLLNTFSYINDWNSMNDFFWQLKWRIPSLEPGTTILTDNFPLKYYSDNSLTAPLNWIYDEKNHSLDLNYMFYFIDVRLGRRLPNLQKNQVINQPYRSFSFISSTDKLLLIYYDPPACVHVLDPILGVENKAIPLSIKQALMLSNKNLIKENVYSEMPSIFNKEPGHSWCFLYERADLALQLGDWDEIVHLGDQIPYINEKPSDLSEYFPFIEGYAKTSNFDSAVKLSRLIFNTSPDNNSMQCALWKRLLARIPLDKLPESVATLFHSELKCLQY